MKVQALALTFVAMFVGGCTDPAVRLASCIERNLTNTSAGASPTRLSCDTRLKGTYLLVLHPQKELSDMELTTAGVPPDQIDNVRQLRLGGESIYVLPLEYQEAASRTTYQSRFVEIQRPLARIKTDSRVIFEVINAKGRPQIVSIR